MEGDGAFYNSCKARLQDGRFNLAAAGHVIRAILVHGYVPDIDNHAVLADVVAAEYPSGLGYVAGGLALSGQTVTQDNVNNCGTWDGNDLSWLGLGPLVPAIPSHCILYDDTDPTDSLICYFELGSRATVGTKYTLRINSAGISRLL